MESQSQPARFEILRLPRSSTLWDVARRASLALILFGAVTALMWFDRDGLRDNAHPDRPLGFVDVLYFTTVSLATVGYGDIAPVTDQARLVNALVLTPVRIIVWVLFLGTAYELTVLRMRYRERYRMRQLRDRLDQHIIVCGFGVKGRAIVDEMLAHDHRPEDIVVIDPTEQAVAAASEQGLTALRGDASSEAMLRAAAIEKASYVLVAPDRDDACVLICLTVRSLAPRAHLIASAREEENIKLIYGAGADLVVSPSASGGRLMAAAVEQKAVAQFLQDLISVEHGMGVAEYIVQPADAGLLPAEIPALRGALLLGAMRGQERCPYSRLGWFTVESGDAIVYLTSDEDQDEETVTDASPTARAR
ncbi:MAG TPA: potassium channel family protein [Thermomicrobiales bacterium]|nr:potassium channel family protein [Thermomicrobiales bacterium]